MSALCLGPLVSTALQAHELTPGRADGSSGLGLFEVGAPLLLAAILYACGVWRLWRQSGVNRGLHVAHVIAFFAGWSALACALLSPLDALGAELFAFHMIQHEVLMLVAAPLLVLGRPLAAFVWAFPSSTRAALARVTQSKWPARAWAELTRPLTAWALHAMALWAWHAPKLFDAVLSSRAVHDAQHISFLGTALLFWSALFHSRNRDHQGTAILYLFTTTVHSGVLGALITLAARPWYMSYANTAPRWGLTALEDQQLGGLIMWVPASLVYIGIALYLLARWIKSSDRLLARG